MSNLTPRHKIAANIVETLEMQATDYRYRHRLPADYRFTALFPHNQQIGRDVLEIAATALAARGIDADWSMWPAEGETKPEQDAQFLLYPPGAFHIEPHDIIDLRGTTP